MLRSTMCTYPATIKGMFTSCFMTTKEIFVFLYNPLPRNLMFKIISFSRNLVERFLLLTDMEETYQRPHASNLQKFVHIVKYNYYTALQSLNLVL